MLHAVFQVKHTILDAISMISNNNGLGDGPDSLLTRSHKSI